MSKSLPTKGQVEAEISDAITRFEKEHMGRGPLETRTDLIEDLVVVRMKGMLTKPEMTLVGVSKDGHGRDPVKQVRRELIETGRPMLEAAVKSATKRKVRGVYFDISTVSGEKIMVFTLEKPPEYASPTQSSS